MAIPLFLSKESEGYNPLERSDSEISETEVPLQKRQRKQWSTIQVFIMLLVSIIVSSISGFTFGVRRQISPGRALLVPAGNIQYPMIYNKTYTLEPTPEINKAWDDMFPKGKGFIQHPEISPNISGIAVFHELHCVNILRIGFYAALSGNLDAMQHVHDHNSRPDPHHLRHCFDYLRQSFICAADTNLEPVNFELGGVTGWQFNRTCRDFEGIKKWAEVNRKWDDSIQEPAEP